MKIDSHGMAGVAERSPYGSAVTSPAGSAVVAAREWFAADVAMAALRIYRGSSGDIFDMRTNRQRALAEDLTLDCEVLGLALDVLGLFAVECSS